jgi:hypothetical protein
MREGGRIVKRARGRLGEGRKEDNVKVLMKEQRNIGRKILRKKGEVMRKIK